MDAFQKMFFPNPLLEYAHIGRPCIPRLIIHHLDYSTDTMPILRKTKFLAGSNIYITEDFSKRVKDKRTELQKFMRKMKKR